jgi:hypothetical protein
METSRDPGADSVETAIAVCQRVLRMATILILGAFVAIIISTTISTGAFVQTLGKGLYYVIVVSAVVSLLTWYYRTRLERRAAG